MIWSDLFSASLWAGTPDKGAGCL